MITQPTSRRFDEVAASLVALLPSDPAKATSGTVRRIGQFVRTASAIFCFLGLAIGMMYGTKNCVLSILGGQYDIWSAANVAASVSLVVVLLSCGVYIIALLVANYVLPDNWYMVAAMPLAAFALSWLAGIFIFIFVVMATGAELPIVIRTLLAMAALVLTGMTILADICVGSLKHLEIAPRTDAGASPASVKRRVIDNIIE